MIVLHWPEPVFVLIEVVVDGGFLGAGWRGPSVGVTLQWRG
jgi:hypothetical protein